MGAGHEQPRHRPTCAGSSDPCGRAHPLFTFHAFRIGFVRLAYGRRCWSQCLPCWTWRTVTGSILLPEPDMTSEISYGLAIASCRKSCVAWVFLTSQTTGAAENHDATLLGRLRWIQRH